MSRWLVVLIAQLLGSCSFLPRQAVVPVPVDSAAPAKPPANETIVMLPGRFEGPQTFRENGAFEQVAELRPKARIAAPDLHFAYYKDRSAVVRLREEVIRPARKKGDRITLTGVSLGGLGALLYALEHPSEVDEILLLSPFVGEPEILEEIRSAGGLKKWQPGDPANDDFQRKLWRGIRDQWVKTGKRPRIRLVVGRDDRFVTGSRLLRDELLAPGDYFEIDGRHNWKAWSEGFRLLLPPAGGR